MFYGQPRCLKSNFSPPGMRGSIQIEVVSIFEDGGARCRLQSFGAYLLAIIRIFVPGAVRQVNPDSKYVSKPRRPRFDDFNSPIWLLGAEE